MPTPSRRAFVRGSLAAAGALSLPTLVGASVLDAPSASAVAPATTVTDQPDPAKFRVGWNAYDYEVLAQDHIDGIARLRPTSIRWFVSWDRYETRDSRKREWLEFRGFLNALATYGVHLQITFLCMDPFWLGDMPWTGGLLFAKQDPLINAPSNVNESYGEFVRGLYAEIAAAGVQSVSLGAWNEVDLRWGTPQNTTNPTYRWNLFSQPGHAYWTGGAGDEYAELYKVLDSVAPNVTWNTSGIGSTQADLRRDWIAATAAIPNVSELDLHIYEYRDLRTVLRDTTMALAEWDKHTETPLPYVFGETNDSPALPSQINPQMAQRLRNMHLAQSLIWPDRYRGMMVHGPTPWLTETAWWDGPYERLSDEQIAVYVIDNLPSQVAPPAPPATTPTAPATTEPPAAAGEAAPAISRNRQLRRRRQAV